MIDRFNRQIDIQVRPIKVVWTLKLHSDQFANTSIFEPRKLLKRNKALSFSNQNPKPMTRDVRDLNFLRNGCSTLAGCHLRAPESIATLPSRRAPLNRSSEPVQLAAQARIGLTIGAINVHMQPRFFAGEKIEAEWALAKHRRTH